MKKTMDANQIKLLAILAMTIDHIAWLVFPGYSKAPLALLMHLIGRMTCPIMCFFIAEGYHHTRDLNRYTLRLFVFAVISHFAYIFASQDFVDARSFIPFYYGGILNQTSGMGSFQTFSSRQNCARMTAICSRVASLCGLRWSPPGPGTPLNRL